MFFAGVLTIANLGCRFNRSKVAIAKWTTTAWPSAVIIGSGTPPLAKVLSLVVIFPIRLFLNNRLAFSKH